MTQARQRARAPLSTTIGALACCALVGWAGSARAQAPAAIGGADRVFVVDLVDNGVGKDTAKKVTDVLRTELAAVTGDRVVRPSAVAAIITRPEVAEQVRCPRENYVECAVAVGQKISVAFVIAGVVAALGDAQLVDLRLVDVRARAEINRLQTPLTGNADRDRSALRELGVRLVAPDSWVGTLELDGLEPGDKLMVDGTAMAATPPRAKLDVAVGSHAVSVSRGDKSLLTQVVEIKYGETAALTLAGGGQSGGSRTSGEGGGASVLTRWPAWVAVGSGVVLAAVAIGFLIDDLVTVRPKMEIARKNGDALKEKETPCAIPDRVTYYCELENWQAYEIVDLSVAGALGVGALVAIGAAVYFFIAPADDATESVAGSSPRKSTP